MMNTFKESARRAVGYQIVGGLVVLSVLAVVAVAVNLAAYVSWPIAAVAAVGLSFGAGYLIDRYAL